MDQSPFLTVGETAIILRKSEKWIYRHASDIPGSLKLFGSWLFDRQTLLEELKKRSRITPKEESRDNPMDRHGLL
jgi:regulator of sigma D